MTSAGSMPAASYGGVREIAKHVWTRKHELAGLNALIARANPSDMSICVAVPAYRKSRVVESLRPINDVRVHAIGRKASAR